MQLKIVYANIIRIRLTSGTSFEHSLNLASLPLVMSTASHQQCLRPYIPTVTNTCQAGNDAEPLSKVARHANWWPFSNRTFAQDLGLPLPHTKLGICAGFQTHLSLYSNAGFPPDCRKPRRGCACSSGCWRCYCQPSESLAVAECFEPEMWPPRGPPILLDSITKGHGSLLT